MEDPTARRVLSIEGGAGLHGVKDIASIAIAAHDQVREVT
jgi:hypothetical protein